MDENIGLKLISLISLYVFKAAPRNGDMSRQGSHSVSSGQQCPGTGKSGHRAHLPESGKATCLMTGTVLQGVSAHWRQPRTPETNVHGLGWADGGTAVS